MSSLEMFYMQKIEAVEHKKVVATARLKDKEGKPLEWEIKSLSSIEDDTLRKKHTKYSKNKKGVAAPTLDTSAYLSNLVVDCVVFPDLRNAELIENWGVATAEDLINKMLTPGEYNELVLAIQDINGWDVDLSDLVDDVKN